MISPLEFWVRFVAVVLIGAPTLVAAGKIYYEVLDWFFDNILNLPDWEIAGPIMVATSVAACFGLFMWAGNVVSNYYEALKGSNANKT